MVMAVIYMSVVFCNYTRIDEIVNCNEAGNMPDEGSLSYSYSSFNTT